MMTLKMLKEYIDEREGEDRDKSAKRLAAERESGPTPTLYRLERMGEDERATTTMFREKYEVLKRLKDKDNKTREDIEEAMKKALCFSSIAYCCGSSENPHGEGKQCPFRDGFLDAIGWSVSSYEVFKEGSADFFWKMMAGKGVVI